VVVVAPLVDSEEPDSASSGFGVACSGAGGNVGVGVSDAAGESLLSLASCVVVVVGWGVLGAWLSLDALSGAGCVGRVVC
jgi:hypothetical protein